MSEQIKGAFKIVTDKETREKLSKILQYNFVGGLMVFILSTIIPVAIGFVTNLTFETNRDWAIVTFFAFIIVMCVVVLIYSVKATSQRIENQINDDRLEEETKQKIDNELQLGKERILSEERIRVKQFDVRMKEIENERMQIENQREVDQFSVEIHNEQKKYQLYLTAMQSRSYYDEMSSIVANIVFLSEVLETDNKIVTGQLKQYHNRLRELIENIGRLPELVEMTYKEYLNFRNTSDRESIRSFAKEIQEIADKVGGKAPIQTEKIPPKPTVSEDE